MRHLERISSYCRSLLASTEIHLLIVEGPQAFAKSYTFRQALSGLGIEYRALSGYFTALNLYNSLAEFPNGLILMDDLYGPLEDLKGVSILKAATWPGVDDARLVAWGTTSGKAKCSEFIFRGKIIFACNKFPKNAHTNALVSRSFPYQIEFDREQRLAALEEAKTSYYQGNPIASEVIDFILSVSDFINEESIQFRTVVQGIELARINPENWRQLLLDLLPKGQSPKELVQSLAQRKLTLKRQLQEFLALTGKGERTFYRYRSELGLGREPSRKVLPLSVS